MIDKTNWQKKKPIFIDIVALVTDMENKHNKNDLTFLTLILSI